MNRPPKSNTIGARALAGEIYPVENKDKRAPASDPKITTRRAPVFPIYDFDRDYIEPTPSAMLGGGEGAGGARRKAPSMRRMLSGIPPCLHSRKTTLFREIPVSYVYSHIGQKYPLTQIAINPQSSGSIRATLQQRGVKIKPPKPCTV